MNYLIKDTFSCKMRMLYYDRIHVSEQIDINETSAKKEYDICHHWYFQVKNLRFKQISSIDVMMY